MKLLAVVRFELAYQIRRPWPWLLFAVVLGLSFLMARDHSLADAMYQDFFANSPFAVAKTTVLGGLMWLLASAVIAGEAGARDVETGMYPLTYTSPVGKTQYLGGRFLAALLLNAVILLAVQVGIILGVYVPGVNPKVIGPFRPEAFLTAYVYIALPNAFAATAIQFLLSVRTGRAMAAYTGSVFLVFMGFFVATLLNFLVMQGLGTLLDPVGMYFIVEDLARLWTTAEKSTRLLALQGTFLANRLIWVSVGFGALALTWLRFEFAHRAEGGWWTRFRRSRQTPAPTPAGLAVTASAPIAIPPVSPSFGLGVQARKTLATAWASFRTIAASRAGLFLLIGIPALSVLVVIAQMETLGTPLMPTTTRVLAELTGGLSAGLASEPSRWVIIPLVIIFFAGELVWRERDANLSEITDAMPNPEWVPVLGKYFGLALVLALFMAIQMAAGMLAQLILGYRNFEPGLYLQVLFGLQLPEYLLFAVLAVVVHTVVNQKYVGHIVAIVAYAFIAVLAAVLGIEHHLLVYGSSPGWSYTYMRGFGLTLGPWLWFKLYWTAWAVLLVVAARLLWVRGREYGPGPRLREARRRFSRATKVVTVLALALVVALGGFIFYNTNILNRYIGSAEIAARRAEYERRYARYERVPQPQLTATKLQIEIYPERRAAYIRGSYTLVNRGGVAIDSIHLATGLSAETRAMTFDRAATLAISDEMHGHRIYNLQRPLEPGDTLRLEFEVQFARRGFTNRGADPAVQRGGTYFTNDGILPAVGYQWMRALLGPAERREHGLAPRPLLATLYDPGNDAALRRGEIAFEAIVGTDPRHIAVTPGALQRTWTEGDRRYFHYKTSAPIGEQWDIFSANYGVREEPHPRSREPVSVRIYHDPRHTLHLDGMMQSARAALSHYDSEFGVPYPYSHLAIVERPGAPGYGAHAEPSLISHGEGLAFWKPRSGGRSFDMPYAVMGHEMGHQWSLPLALVEGLPFMAEGLAWYFSMDLVRQVRGDWQFRRLMRFMRLPFPWAPIRRGEPLLRAADPYQGYRKGPFALYALSEYVGWNRVNGALRRLFQQHSASGGEAVTTLDLYRELQAVTPDSLRPLLRDLFEVNTFWQFQAERATAEKTGDSTWQVTLVVRSRKTQYDTAGVATEMPMDDWAAIGVFGAGEPGDELANPLYLSKHRIRSGQQTITVTVSHEPRLAGIDPYHLLDWEEGEDDDNIEAVQTATRP